VPDGVDASPAFDAPLVLDGASVIAGRVVVSGTSPGVTGQTIVQESLEVRGSLANSAVTVTTGSLIGSGTVGALTAVGGRVHLEPDGNSLQTGDLTLNTGVVLFNRLFGPQTNVGYGQLRVTGTVTLANATLDVRLLKGMSQNHVFTLVDNDGVDPVVGTFEGLPEGATLTSPGAPTFPS
jgi:hypothetical protein